MSVTAVCFTRDPGMCVCVCVGACLHPALQTTNESIISVGRISEMLPIPALQPAGPPQALRTENRARSRGCTITPERMSCGSSHTWNLLID